MKVNISKATVPGHAGKGGNELDQNTNIGSPGGILHDQLRHFKATVPMDMMD